MSTEEILKSIDSLEPHKALASLDKALADHADDRLWYTRGSLLYAAAWVNRVLDGFADRIGWPKQDIRARAWLASDDGQWSLSEAIRSFGAALASNPRLAKIRYLQGRAQKLAGDLTSTAQAYEQCLELAPRIPFAQYHLAQLYESRGDEDAALDLYEKIFAEHPDFIEAKIAAGNILRRRDRPVAAARLYASALTIPRAFFNARWRIMSNVDVNELIPVEDTYNGYTIWFEHDQFVGIPNAAPPPPPPQAIWVPRLRQRLISHYHRALAPLVPNIVKRILNKIVNVLLKIEQRLRQQQRSTSVKRAPSRRLHAKQLSALKTAIDRVSR